MSKKDLVDHLYQQHHHRGLTRKKIEDVVETFFLHLSNMILLRKDIGISKFGHFRIKKKKKTRIRHPQTHQWIEVPSKKQVKFYPSPVLHKKINSKVD